MAYFVVVRKRGPAWQSSLPMRQQPDWEAHARFMDALADEHVILAGGPLGDEDTAERVLLVVEAREAAAIETRLQGDPWTGRGLLETVSIEPWTVLLGGLRSAPPPTAGKVLHAARLYDIGVWVMTLGREHALRQRMLRLARLSPGRSVLDVGCGTGTLALAAARHVGANETVHGVDPSPEMIARAQEKARRANVRATFDVAAAEALKPSGRTLIVDVATDRELSAQLNDAGFTVTESGRLGAARLNYALAAAGPRERT